MSELKLEQIENSVAFEVEMENSNLMGVISNKHNCGKFCYEPSDIEGQLTAYDLRTVADQLDKLNGVIV